MADKALPKIITLLEEIIRTGRDPRTLLESMLHRLADLTRAIYQVPAEGSDATRESSLHEIATRLGKNFLIQVRSDLADAHKIIRDISLPRLWLESELIRISTAGTRVPVQAEAKPGSVAKPVEMAKPKETPSISDQPRAVVQTSEPKVIEEKAEEPKPAVRASSADKKPEENDWDRLWNAIPVNPKTGMAPPIKLNLRSASLVSDDSKTMVVSVDSEMNLQWLQENTQRIKFVTDQLATIGREGTNIEFILEKKNDRKLIESEAVELQVEGARLERLVKEVFNLSDSKEEDLG